MFFFSFRCLNLYVKKTFIRSNICKFKFVEKTTLIVKDYFDCTFVVKCVPHRYYEIFLIELSPTGKRSQII